MSIITLEARSPVDHFMGVRPQKDKEEFPYGWRYVIKNDLKMIWGIEGLKEPAPDPTAPKKT
jgi:hypothetical protein